MYEWYKSTVKEKLFINFMEDDQTQTGCEMFVGESNDSVPSAE